jgi:aspartyl aminopeptidase
MAYADEFAAFLTKSGTLYNFYELARSLLLHSGFPELSELQCCVALPSKFFVVRDGKSFLAFRLDSPASAVIIGAHNDSPVLKVKPDSFQTFSSALEQWIMRAAWRTAVTSAWWAQSWSGPRISLARDR